MRLAELAAAPDGRLAPALDTAMFVAVRWAGGPAASTAHTHVLTPVGLAKELNLGRHGVLTRGGLALV